MVRYEANAEMNSHQPHVFSASCPQPTTTLSHQLTCSDLVTPIPSSAVTELDAMRKKERKKKTVKTTLLTTAESVSVRASDAQL